MAVSNITGGFTTTQRGGLQAFKVIPVIVYKVYADGRPDELVRVVPDPETIHIVVCGDPHRNRAMVLWGGYVNPVSRRIDSPAH